MELEFVNILAIHIIWQIDKQIKKRLTYYFTIAYFEGKKCWDNHGSGRNGMNVIAIFLRHSLRLGSYFKMESNNGCNGRKFHSSYAWLKAIFVCLQNRSIDNARSMIIRYRKQLIHWLRKWWKKKRKVSTEILGHRQIQWNENWFFGTEIAPHSIVSHQFLGYSI